MTKPLQVTGFSDGKLHIAIDARRDDVYMSAPGAYGEQSGIAIISTEKPMRVWVVRFERSPNFSDAFSYFNEAKTMGAAREHARDLKRWLP
jgi:hypothetical protein